MPISPADLRSRGQNWEICVVLSFCHELSLENPNVEAGELNFELYEICMQFHIRT